MALKHFVILASALGASTEAQTPYANCLKANKVGVRYDPKDVCLPLLSKPKPYDPEIPADYRSSNEWKTYELNKLKADIEVARVRDSIARDIRLNNNGLRR